MSGFANEEELDRYIGGIFREALQDPELAPKLKATGLVLLMKCTEPESALVVDFPNGEVFRGGEGPEPQATMTMTTATANAYWQGKVNLTFAMAKGKVKVEGTITKLLQLAPLSKRLFPGYVERLKADGRNDLVVD